MCASPRRQAGWSARSGLGGVCPVPVLRQTQRGDWIVRLFTGTFRTRHLTARGEEILHHLNIRDDGDTFDLRLFNTLERIGGLRSASGHQRLLFDPPTDNEKRNESRRGLPL